MIKWVLKNVPAYFYLFITEEKICFCAGDFWVSQHSQVLKMTTLSVRSSDMSLFR